jgi:hypothetical protein
MKDQHEIDQFYELAKELETYKLEAIYNYEYFMVKDDNLIKYQNLTELYGADRNGFEKFKQTYLNSTSNTRIDNSKERSIRFVRQDGKAIAAVIETTKQIYTSLSQLQSEYERAYDLFKDILKVADHDSFDYWYIKNFYPEPEYYSIIKGIKNFGTFLTKYNSYDKQKKFIHFVNKLKD